MYSNYYELSYLTLEGQLTGRKGDASQFQFYSKFPRSTASGVQEIQPQSRLVPEGHAV